MKKEGQGRAGRLVVHAPNVHFGGGAVLLSSILSAEDGPREVVLLCDTRMVIDPRQGRRVQVYRFKPTIAGRFAAELKLREVAKAEDTVLAFGNLPPIFRLQSDTVLFLQHPYLVDSSMPLGGFSNLARARIAVERVWIKWRIGNVDRIIVQTASMASRFQLEFSRTAEIVPFRPPQPDTARQLGQPQAYDFIYVASSEPHKNHTTLLDAWVLLAESGVRPSLALTLSAERDVVLIERLNELNQGLGTKITNLGRMPSLEVAKAYAKSGMLIFPSLGESFGLPLIEANEMGLPIIASELDYVRDLVVPVQTFDPRSPRSIARAVCRALALPSDVHQPVGTDHFLRQVCGQV